MATQYPRILNTDMLNKCPFQDFLESTRARRYVIAIGVEAFDGQLGRFVNKNTLEVLIVYRKDSTRAIEVERKSTDDNL